MVHEKLYYVVNSNFVAFWLYSAWNITLTKTKLFLQYNILARFYLTYVSLFFFYSMPRKFKFFVSTGFTNKYKCTKTNKAVIFKKITAYVKYNHLHVTHISYLQWNVIKIQLCYFISNFVTATHVAINFKSIIENRLYFSLCRV